MGFKVIFVGDKPSKHNTDPRIAFLGTKSYKTLLNWMEALEVEDFQLVNRTDPNFVEVVDKAVKDQYNVVALGKEAHIALLNINIGHYGLPHPSGRNRWLNDKTKLAAYLKACKEYLT